jgi:hypothetical protein
MKKSDINIRKQTASKVEPRKGNIRPGPHWQKKKSKNLNIDFKNHLSSGS